MRHFTWVPGAPKVEMALALGALRPGGGRFPYTLVVGPCQTRTGTLYTGMSVECGLYAAPADDLPIHSTLAGIADEVRPGVFARGFFLRDLVANVGQRGNQVLYGCADGPGWRVVVPVRVVPDAQFFQRLGWVMGG